MATTAGGTPYVESSDLVANYPAVSLALADHIDTLTGKVIQIVYGSYSSYVGSSTSTYVDTGLTATITPTSASNKILVIVFQSGLFKENSNTSNQVRLLRAGTEIIIFENTGYTGDSARQSMGAGGCAYLDSPATTAATIYKTQFRSTANTSNVQVQSNNSRSTICLMEVTP